MNLSPENYSIYIRSVLKILSLWGISQGDSSKLLNVTNDRLYKWSVGLERDCLNQENLIRISLILGIYKTLQTLLPNSKAADEWVCKSNGAPLFNSKSPLEYILNNPEGTLKGLEYTRNHLYGVANQ